MQSDQSSNYNNEGITKIKNVKKRDKFEAMAHKFSKWFVKFWLIALLIGIFASFGGVVSGYELGTYAGYLLIFGLLIQGFILIIGKIKKSSKVLSKLLWIILAGLIVFIMAAPVINFALGDISSNKQNESSRTAFIESCVGDKSDLEKTCGCFYDYLFSKYSDSELYDITNGGKEIPQSTQDELVDHCG